MRRQLFPPAKQIETKLKIFHAIDRPIDQMTVSMICEKSGISRQLFYRYFDSKYDIPFWYTVECDRATISEIGRSLTWKDGLEDFFTLIYDERQIMRYFANSKDSRSSRHMADERRYDVFVETITQFRGKELDQELDFYASTFSNTFNKAFSMWIKQEMSIPPKTIAMYIYELVPTKLHNAMELTTTK